MSDNDLIRRIKVTLRQRNMTQRELAQRIGKKESEVSRWMSGRMGISKASLRRIEEVLELPRTSPKPIKIGLIGTGSIAARFAAEAAHVEGCYLSAAYNPDIDAARLFADRFGIEAVAATPEELLAQCDAVYIASPYKTHYDYAMQALQASRHVLCETPFTLTRRQAADLYTLAQRKGLTLLVALKTAYCPSFQKLIEIARSGEIGQIVDICATVTTMLDPARTTDDFNEDRLKENATYPLLAAFKLFGTKPEKVNAFTRTDANRIIYAHATLQYPDAVATIKVGTGVKSEGSLVISGTRGYLYVPAPWWKTDYFEVRFENTADNRKVYFPYEQAGLRYEIQQFITCIRNASDQQLLTREESLKMVEITEKYLNK